MIKNFVSGQLGCLQYLSHCKMITYFLVSNQEKCDSSMATTLSLLKFLGFAPRLDILLIALINHFNKFLGTFKLLINPSSFIDTCCKLGTTCNDNNNNTHKQTKQNKT